MRIWVYTVCFNEQHFVKNFLAAYKEAERIVVYDNMSTDDTVRLLKEDPRVEIRSWDSGNQIRDDKYLEIKNNCWKEARGIADWAIVCDFDEAFCRAVINKYNQPQLSLDLDEPYYHGYTIIKPYGYNMVTLYGPLGAPGHPYEYCQKGVYHWPQEKPCCFRPDKITEINFSPGCHAIDPKGEVNVYSGEEYKLLHFKLWNLELYLEKIQINASRLSAINIEHGWGGHYLWSRERHYDGFMRAYGASRPLFEIKRTEIIYV